MKIQAYTRSTLAAAYNVSVKTLNKWIKPIEKLIGETNGRTFTPKQVKIIVQHLGETD